MVIPPDPDQERNPDEEDALIPHPDEDDAEWTDEHGPAFLARYEDE
jgi:hypothetical protein